MKPNISIFDTIIRIFVGIIIGASFGAFANPIGILAFYPIVTALIAWDPIYQRMKWYTTEVSPYEEAQSPAPAVTRGPERKPYKMSA